MQIEIRKLPPGGKRFEGTEPAEALALEDDPVARAAAPLRYSLRAQATPGRLVVDGSLAVEAEFVCSRCAVALRLTVREPAFHCDVETGPDTEYVDLTPHMRESILLGFPSYPVCDASCRGLCAQCGANLNRGACECGPAKDPRWGALDGLAGLS